MRKAALAGAVILGITILGVIMGESSRDHAGAAVIVGVVFGIAAAIPTALLIVLIAPGQRRTVRHEHHHDNRKVVFYIQRPDGSLELLREQDVRLIEAAPNGVGKPPR